MHDKHLGPVEQFNPQDALTLMLIRKTFVIMFIVYNQTSSQQGYNTYCCSTR